MKLLNLALHGDRGHQLWNQLENLSGVEAIGVSGISFEKWRQKQTFLGPLAERLPWFRDLAELLSSSATGLVSICSNRRASQCEDVEIALNAGWHVLAEKPLAMDQTGLQRLRDMARDSKRLLLTMTPSCYNPVLRGMRRLVSTGRLGTILQVFAQKSYPFHDNRPADEAIDGGLTRQAGIHAVDFIRVATGCEFSRVYCIETSIGNSGKGDLKMASSITAAMNDGAVASIVVNYGNPPSIGYHGNDHIRVFGTRGMVEWVDGFTRGRFVPLEGPEETLPEDFPSHPYPQDIIHSLREGTLPLLTTEDCFRTTSSILAAVESARTNCSISLPDFNSDPFFNPQPYC